MIGLRRPRHTIRPVTTETLRVPGELREAFLKVDAATTIPKITQEPSQTGDLLYLYAHPNNGGDITITRVAKNLAGEGQVSTSSESNIVLNPNDAVVLVRRQNGGWMDLATANPT